MWFAVAGTVAAAAIAAGVFIRGRGARSHGAPTQPAPAGPPGPPRSPEPYGRRGEAQQASQPSRPTTPAPTSPSPAGSAMSYNRSYPPQFWITVIAPYAAIHGVPLEYAIAALTEESAGNPCAIGSPEQYGPDGAPRELGIYQFFNPDDLQFLKLTSTQLRAYCSPNKVPYKVKRRDGTVATVMGPSQEVIRPLTADELGVQGKGTVDKIVKDRGTASRWATAARLTWPSDGVDFWRLVKLVHGLPGLVSVGLVNVAAHLGHAPTSWAEFRHAIESGAVHCDAATEAHRGDDNFGHIFDNAEKATATMRGKAIA